MSKTWEVNLSKGKHQNLPDPIGFTKNFGDVAEGEQRSSHQIKEAWEKKIKAFAMSPAQSILMVLLMMWMQGGGLNIFTIFFVFSVIMQPLKGLFGVNQAFKQFEGKGVVLFPYKLIYAGIQCIVLGIGFYKFYTMGLLPLSPSDWIDLIPHQIDEQKAFPIEAY